MNIPPPCLDEKLWRLGDAMRRGKLDPWAFGVAKSLLRQAKRPNWRPSRKQNGLISKLLSDAAKHSGADTGTGSLIDWEDTHALWAEEASKAKARREPGSHASEFIAGLDARVRYINESDGSNANHKVPLTDCRGAGHQASEEKNSQALYNAPPSTLRPWSPGTPEEGEDCADLPPG